MATMITIRKNVGRSNEYISCIQMLQGGFGKLAELNGTRAQAIGNPAGGTTEQKRQSMMAAFGASTEQEAQDQSDRWAYLVAAMTDPTHEAYASMQFVRDTIDTVIF